VIQASTGVGLSQFCNVNSFKLAYKHATGMAKFFVNSLYKLPVYLANQTLVD